MTPARIAELRALVEATSGADATIGSVFHAADTALDELPALLDEVERLRVLDGLAKHTNWELSFGCLDDEAEGAWHVYRIGGGVNDREWTLIGSGPTPSDAIQQALEGGQ